MNRETASKRATRLLAGKVVCHVLRHGDREVMVHFVDGARLHAHTTKDGRLELSVTEGGCEGERGATKLFQLWRQDDNGNTFLVGTFVRENEALARKSDLESGGHKQFYWIAGVYGDV